MVLPIKLRPLLRRRNALRHNLHHAIPDILLGRSILGTDPQLETEHGEILPLVHDTAAVDVCLLYTSPSPRDLSTSRMPSSA